MREMPQSFVQVGTFVRVHQAQHRKEPRRWQTAGLLGLRGRGHSLRAQKGDKHTHRAGTRMFDVCPCTAHTPSSLSMPVIAPW